MSRLWASVLAMVLVGAGCGGPRVIEEYPVPQVKYEPKKVKPGRLAADDKALLEEALNRQVMDTEEVIALSDRLLRHDNPAVRDKDTLDKLQILLLRSLQDKSKDHYPQTLRNLGIVNYYQKQYMNARQALQASSELNPRDGRTHFYLACIYAEQGRIHYAQGQKRKSAAQYKRAQIELEQARKLEPSNPLYRQDLKQVMETD
ncbi:MAG: tetratricopeptide repeat protein [Deltaproteobacteria bacterium]|nr:tetratricopeptide repeat protein [Deltaproteobacteria bacterium]MBW1951897.1 tetratricopeptide repeat protein [Deltaproteobacteria bacterium]MBW1986961.1 tetratricopeptide repeat protein [Deltaproteobacteria bacterium]MBW2134476.1 tetratricopeptide repeat protein [Deltaproteobacteria bacterium]